MTDKDTIQKPVTVNLTNKELKLCISDRLTKLKRAHLKFRAEFGDDSAITKAIGQQIASLQTAHAALE